jgi:hypothetical protein
MEVVNAILGAGESFPDGDYSNPQEFLEKTHSYTYIERSRYEHHGKTKRSANSAVNAIIKHRQKQKQMFVHRRRVRAAHVLYRFFRRARQRQIELVNSYAATIIQRHTRGHIVRCNMDVIVASLISRKRDTKKKKKARGVLKNWIQKSINTKREGGGSFDEETAVTVPEEKPNDPVEAVLVEQAREYKEVKQSESFGAMKIFDVVGASSSEESRRPQEKDDRITRFRSRSEDIRVRSQSQNIDRSNDRSSSSPPEEFKRSQSMDPRASLSPPGGRHKALLGGLIPAHPSMSAKELSTHAPVTTRSRSFIITEALRRRELRIQQAAEGGVVVSLLLSDSHYRFIVFCGKCNAFHIMHIY